MDFKSLIVSTFRKEPEIFNHTSTILSRRDELMGVAIILVILYHLYCWCNYGHFDLFKYGYIGVDIFMYVSGLGLCFSYNKRSLLSFYKRRMIRIIPIFCVFNIILLLISYDNTLQLKHVVGSFTTLNFYDLSSNSKEWFISSILLLYLLFPVIYKSTTGKAIVTASILIAIVGTFFKLDWRHDCLLSRLPIFMLGILSYKLNIAPPNSQNRNAHGICLVFMTVGLYTFLKCQSPSLLTAMTCPLALVLILRTMSNNESKCLKIIEKNTLELFLANGIVGYYMISPWIELWIGYKLPLYFGLQIIFSIIFIIINKPIKKAL